MDGQFRASRGEGLQPRPRPPTLNVFTRRLLNLISQLGRVRLSRMWKFVAAAKNKLELAVRLLFALSLSLSSQLLLSPSLSRPFASKQTN